MVLTSPSIPYSLQIGSKWCRIIHDNRLSICSHSGKTVRASNVASVTNWATFLSTAHLKPVATPKPQMMKVPRQKTTQPHNTHLLTIIQQLRQIQPPAMNHWRQILGQDPQFNTTFWKTINSKLATNKQGDVNWKIAHRILPTALSLHCATVYNTPNCPHCQTLENNEHPFIHCQFTQTLWTNIQSYTHKMTHNTLQLTDNIKLLPT